MPQLPLGATGLNSSAISTLRHGLALVCRVHESLNRSRSATQGIFFQSMMTFLKNGTTLWNVARHYSNRVTARHIVPIRTFATHSRLAPSHLRLFQTNNAQIVLQTCSWMASRASHLHQLLCNCRWWLASVVASSHPRGEDLAVLPCPFRYWDKNETQDVSASPALGASAGFGLLSRVSMGANEANAWVRPKRELVVQADRSLTRK